MEYAVIESRLKTDKSRDYLWSKMNSPEKIIEIEGFKDTKVKRLSEHNYELYFGKRYGFLTFIPRTGVNLTFFLDNDSSLAWFEIIGEEDCELVHGTAVRTDADDGNWYKEHKARVEQHFLEELSFIAK